MVCKKCGKKNTGINTFCSNCGTKTKEKTNYRKCAIVACILIGVVFIGQKSKEYIKEYVDDKMLALSKEIIKGNDDKDSDDEVSMLNSKEESLNEIEENDVHQEETEYINDDVSSLNFDEEEKSMDEINTEIINLIEQLQTHYDNAINTGDVSQVYPYITTTGNLYDSYSENIPIWHKEGMKTFIEEAEYTDMELNDDGTYRVGRYSICKVDRSGSVVYEKEYIDFIIKEENGKFLVDSCKNYEMIDNNYDYY